MRTTLLSIFVSLFPQRYRSRWGSEFVSPMGAGISGVGQLVVCLGMLLYGYLVFAHQRLFATSNKVLLGVAETGGETAVAGMGLFVLAEYVIRPMTLILLYFTFEGAVRGIAAIVTGEIVPTLPLQFLAWLHGLGEHRHREWKMGPRIVDEIVLGVSPEFDLRVDSCRPKPWNNLTTIVYNDQLYEVVKELPGQPPRPFVYLLRKTPVGKVVRGLYHYKPEETLQES